MPANFTPVLALATFSPIMIQHRWLQMLVPISAMFVSDLMLGLHSTMIWVYLCVALSPVVSTIVNNLLVAGSLNVLIWHVVVNGIVYVQGHGYPPFTVESMLFDFRLWVSTILFLMLFSLTHQVFKGINNERQIR
jgi:hypothetical protein